MNNIKPGPMANALALHYFSRDEIDHEGWFEYAEQWFAKHGLEPTKMSGKSGKNITFKRGKLNLQKESFQDLKKNGLWIGALPPEEYIGTESFDFLFAADLIQLSSFTKGNVCTFCWDDQILPWDEDYIQSLAKDLCQFFKPKYGYAFQRKFKHGPIYYPSGVGAHDGRDVISWEEGGEIANWGNVGLREHDDYKPEMLRDVYPLNFLSAQHLEGIVESKPLKQWILEDLHRGELNEVLPGFWSWSVASESIEPVREVLKKHNLLIAHLDV
jgi:hypothetical protein